MDIKALSTDSFKQAITEDLIIIDSRQPVVFSNGFIPGSVNIGLQEKFSEWASNLIPANSHLLIVTEAGQETETANRLKQSGFSTISGYLNGGFETWRKAGEPTDMIIDVEADELIMDIPFDNNLVILDVRKEAEFDQAHLKNAINIPLLKLTDPGSMANFEDEQNIYIYSAGGYRSVIAASLLKRQDIHNLRNVLGGWNKIKEQKKAELVKVKRV
ncbi:MAG: rhodanese-like domain-containing protein [Chitinophagaceae bacterium]|nr:rhodanese-like domain-containing protein [Chitinophagaceae bacterium]MBK8953181.1 rhodanese-like domain-containing protein [Chitinophagaceae bacterium]